MTRENVRAVFGSASRDVRAACAAEIARAAAVLRRAVADAEGIGAADAMLALCERAAPSSSRWMTKATLDLAMLGGLGGEGDELSRLLCALRGDLAVCAAAWEDLRGMTEEI